MLPIFVRGASNERNKDKVSDAEEKGTIEGGITGTRVAKEGNLQALKDDYAKMGANLRAQYEKDMAADGLTNGITADGNQFDSALQAGMRGGRATSQSRQNALERELGLDVTQYQTSTQANVAGIPGSTNNPSNATLPSAAAPSEGAQVATLSEETTSPVTDDQTTSTEAARQAALKKKLAEQNTL